MVEMLDKPDFASKLLGEKTTGDSPVPRELNSLPYEEVLANLDRQIAFLRARLERLEYLRFALEDPGADSCLRLAMTHTWEEMFTDFPLDETRTPAPPVAPGREPTNYQKIEFCFRSRSNDWLTSGQLASLTGVRVNVLRDILYKTHKDQFERKDNPEGRGKLFRLKKESEEEK